MKCKETRQIFRKWFIIKVQDFTKRFSNKMGEATNHAMDCDRCRGYYNQLVDKYSKELPDGNIIYTYMEVCE